MLRVEKLETAYGVSQVLFGVTFAIRPGEVVTLLGRNGMGKTTTVLSIMGVVAARAGSVALNGKELRGLPSYRLAPAGGAVGGLRAVPCVRVGGGGWGAGPEGRQVFPTLPVRENLVATAANRSGR